MIEQQLEWNVCPVGYNARGTDKLIDQLMSQERVLLIDTRKSPRSNRPEWMKEALEKKYGSRYRYAGRYLGNRNFANSGPIEIVDPATGLRGLRMYLSEGYRLILLCACREFSECHRRTIVEMLCASTPGVRVMEPDLPAAGSGNSFMQKEWTPQEGKICSLSIQQPFASAITEGKKSIELRGWGTDYRGIMAIHAGAKWYGGLQIGRAADAGQIQAAKEAVRRLKTSTRVGDYPTSAIIGVARLVQCRCFASEDEYESLRPAHKGSQEWDERDYGWHFVDVVKLPEPIKARGYLGLFGVDREPLEGFLREVGEA